MPTETLEKPPASEAAKEPSRGNPYKRDIAVTPEFMQKYSIKRQGQEVVMVKGLMHLAHELGFQSVKTRFTAYPAESNGWTAFAETEVIDEFGRVWIEAGDANDRNVGKQVAPHYPRMALTRSKGRCLRDSLGLQLLVDEELEVMVQTAQDGFVGNRASIDQFNDIKDLRTKKGKDRDWVMMTAATLFEKAPPELTEKEADVILFLLRELPDAAEAAA